MQFHEIQNDTDELSKPLIVGKKEVASTSNVEECSARNYYHQQQSSISDGDLEEQTAASERGGDGSYFGGAVGVVETAVVEFGGNDNDDVDDDDDDEDYNHDHDAAAAAADEQHQGSCHGDDDFTKHAFRDQVVSFLVCPFVYLLQYATIFMKSNNKYNYYDNDAVATNEDHDDDEKTALITLLEIPTIYGVLTIPLNWTTVYVVLMLYYLALYLFRLSLQHIHDLYNNDNSYHNTRRRMYIGYLVLLPEAIMGVVNVCLHFNMSITAFIVMIILIVILLIISTTSNIHIFLVVNHHHQHSNK